MNPPQPLTPAHRLPDPRHLRLGGLWGKRLRDTLDRWAVHVSDDALLDGFRHRPGVQPWIGEHLGKFLDGAVRANDLVDHGPLAAKVQRLVEEWVTHQEADGYLGTYLPADRWQPGDKRREAQTPCWDLWVHKYAILALLTCYEHTGWAPALEAAARAGDLVAREFGAGRPRDLNRTDEHAGLASGSILEAVLRLYGHTGETRHLDLARRIVTDFWERKDGPALLPKLRAGAPIHTLGDGKAYEMMSCFVGLVDYCRATGDGELLERVTAARDRIADQLRYPTGGMSDVEWFKPPGRLREEAPLETCVSFTWIQWNLRLFELTGEARALDLAEETAWNQILPAVCPDGGTWTYHLPTTGPKVFARRWIQGVDGRYGGAALSCCHTNGQRALSLLPAYQFTVSDAGELAVNFYGAASARAELPAVGTVHVEQRTDFPRSGSVELRLTPGEPASGRAEPLPPPGRPSGASTSGLGAGSVDAQAVTAPGAEVAPEGAEAMPDPSGAVPCRPGAGPAQSGTFTLALRRPPWCTELRVDGAPAAPDADGRVRLRCSGPSVVQVELAMEPRVTIVGGSNRGKVSLGLGPLVFALDEPPPGWALDNTALQLDPRGALHGVRVDVERGWPVLEVPVVRLPDAVVASPAGLANAPTAVARLRPILFAGLGPHAWWEDEERNGDSWEDVESPLPEYRSLLPWLPPPPGPQPASTP